MVITLPNEEDVLTRIISKPQKEMIEAGKAPDFIEDKHGIMWFRKRICVPDVDHLREKIL
jgi:hypothetical protein